MSSRARTILIACLAALFLGLLSVSGCARTEQSTTPQRQEAEQPPAQEEPGIGFEGDELYTPAYKPTGEEVAVIKTTKGEITVALFGKDAPIHVGNFVELAEKGFYDETKFHRYIPGFVIQGGDPDTKNAATDEVASEAAKGDGRGRFGVGGPGYNIKGEFDPTTNPNKHEEGTLAMARGGSPDSAGSQFYFALAPLPQLDGSYTVFGRVTDGLEVMRELRAGDSIQLVEITGKTK